MKEKKFERKYHCTVIDYLKLEYINIGERLYVKGLNCKENKTKKINELKEYINKDIYKNLTFKPQINKSPFPKVNFKYYIISSLV